MSRSSSLRLAAALLLAAVAIVAGCENVRPPGFAHRVHLTTSNCGGPGQPACPTCASCHGGIRQSEERALPAPADCAKCHEPAAAQKYGEDTKAAHGGEGKIVFSHERHLKMPEIRDQCVKCHGGLLGSDPEASAIPPMSTCLDCHKGAFERAECGTCHHLNDLVKLVPRTLLRHDASWSRNHGMEATSQQAVCNQCHSKSYCADCHDHGQTISIEARKPEAIGREMNHRGDFMSRHPIEARSDPGSCARCHATSTCEACHLERGVSGGRIGSVSPHPAGWVGPNFLARDFHGRAARRDVVTCATCHDQGPATNCIRCHKVGGPAGNPHPSGWRTSQSPTDPMCRYCHEQ